MIGLKRYEESDIDSRKSKWPKKQLFALLSVFFIDNFGLAIAYPIFTPLILKTHLGLLNPACSLGIRTIYLGILLASFPIGQFIGAPLFGYLADVKGRKKAFYFTLGGEIFGFLLSGVSIHLHSYSFLLISRLITGFFAGNLTICLSAIADISGNNPKVRSKNFGFLASATGLSFILGIIIGGYFSNVELDPLFTSSLPFLITSLLALFNLFIIHFFYKGKHIVKTKASSFFFSSLTIPQIKSLLLIFFFFLTGWIGSIQFLSAIEIEHFSASKEAITYSLVSSGILWAVANAYLNPLLLKKLHPKTLIVFFLPLFALFLLGSALSRQFLTFLLFFNGIALFASIAWTNLVTLISLRAPADVQGRTLGFNQSVTSLATCAAPFVGGIFAARGTTYIYLAYTSLVIVSLFIFLLNKTLYSTK